MSAYLLERAWVDGAVHDDVLVEIEDGRFVRVEAGGSSDAAARLSGLTLPGLLAEQHRLGPRFPPVLRTGEPDTLPRRGVIGPHEVKTILVGRARRVRRETG